MNKEPVHLKSFFLEMETAFAQQLEEETVDTVLEADSLIAEKLFWENLSIPNAFELLKKSPILFSFEMSFTTNLFSQCEAWLSEFDKTWGSPSAEKSMPKAPNDSLASSGTQKKRKLDTSMSTIVVPTPRATADASSSKASKTSSAGKLAELLQSTPLKAKTGSTGLNIFLRHQGTSYTYKSPIFPSGEMFINLNVSDNPAAMKMEGPLTAWKTQYFRSKIVVGRLESESQERFKKIRKLIEELQVLLIQEGKSYPELEESQE